jgi:hypothetical protein
VQEGAIVRKPIIVAVLLLATTTLFADGFRIGASVTAEFADRPNVKIWLDWISTADLRYHILGSETYLDPFVEAGFGAAGRSDITNYEKVGAGTNDYTPTNLSLFGQVGAGLAF